MKVLRYLKIVVIALALSFIAWAIIIYPERYITRCFEGFCLWAECVLPSLFPFMVITLIFIKSGFAEKAALPLKRVTGIFGLPPSAAVCFLISICSGYPAGSKVVAEFYESGCFSPRDCKKLCAICSTSGPLFIIGSVGVKMFGDKSAGWKLMLAHAAAVLISGLIISLILKKGENKPLRRAEVSENLLYECFHGAVISVAVAGGFIAFFCVAAGIFADFNILYPLQQLIGLFTDEATAGAVCQGLLEATTGCRDLSSVNSPYVLPFAGFIITFGGVSILLQQLSYLLKAKVSAPYFIGVKFLQGVLCFLLLLLMV